MRVADKDSCRYRSRLQCLIPFELFFPQYSGEYYSTIDCTCELCGVLYTDIDECQRPGRVCSQRQRCVNTEGSYTCEGPSGPATDQTDHCPVGYAEEPTTGRCEGPYQDCRRYGYDPCAMIG